MPSGTVGGFPEQEIRRYIWFSILQTHFPWQPRADDRASTKVYPARSIGCADSQADGIRFSFTPMSFGADTTHWIALAIEGTLFD